ncbi:MAG: TrkH family potassium uptake protein [Planctomycetota bacterium]
MNYRFVVQQLGLLALVLAGAMVLVAVAVMLSGTAWRSPEMVAMTTSAGIVGAIGFVLQAVGRPREGVTLGRREALLLVGMTWLLGAVAAGLPYWLWARFSVEGGAAHVFMSPMACYFEAMSGLTTTGATVLADVDGLPRGLLLWRSLTHWLGGLGIVVLFVAVLPSLGVGGKRLFAAESTGPTKQGVRPQVRETARALWLIYVGLTLAAAVLLWSLGMPMFDAVNHAMSALSTGGFSTRTASIAAFDSAWIDAVLIVFMVLGGINFALYYRLTRGDVGDLLADRELRWYLGIIVAATAAVTALLVGGSIVTTAGRELGSVASDVDAPDGVGVFTAFRYAAFSVVAIQTTTGFGTSDFDLWPFKGQMVIVALMVVGGCAGSTSGGIKVVRMVTTIKVLASEIGRVFRPAKVRPIRFGEATVTAEVRQSTLAYVLIVGVLWVVGVVGLMLLEGGWRVGVDGGVHGVDFQTAATASFATLNNIGPGLGGVGPTEHYGGFGPASMMLMSVLMAMGRLELFAILVLFVPSFWRRG